MKTVQYYLKSLDYDRIVNDYYERTKNEYFESETFRKMSLEQIEFIARKRISKYIDRLMKINPVHGQDISVLYAYEGYQIGDDFTHTIISLIHLKELQEGVDKVQTYAYEFVPQSEIMNFLVADTEYTQRNIYKIITDVLYEASFFGFEEETKEDSFNTLKESLNDALGDINSIKELFSKNLKENLAMGECTEDIDSKVDLHSNIIKAIQEFNKYSSEKELNLILNSCN